MSGVWLAVLGADGSGKSSVIDHLRRRAASDFPATRTYHLRPHVGRPVDPAPVPDPHGRAPRGRMASFAKLLLWWADCTVGWALHIRPALRRGQLVLFDRYVHDLLVDPRRYRYGGPMGWARFLVGHVPTPDAFVVLDASPAVLRTRKREVTPEETVRQSAAYRALGKALPGARVVDASRPLAEVAGEVEKLLGDLARERNGG